MNITLAAIGKMKSCPERELFDGYVKRLPWKLTLKERDAKKSRGREEETAWLLDQVSACHRLMVLDERGKSVSSEQLASTIGQWQQQGSSSIGIIIGGADGLDQAQLKPADLIVSFGQLTWPHMLVRPMLAEQLYRIHTLLIGHPYHRS